jgi:glycosyltransferase involved in cell wall biosynthesis
MFSGPISVSVYIKEKKELEILYLFVKNNQNFKTHVSFHLVFAQEDQIENPRKLIEPSESFPINFLRNVAIKYAKTELVLYVDADFIVSKNLFEDTKSNSFS